MKLVSASKFAKANGAIVAARPYAHAFADLQGRILDLAKQGVSSPLIIEKEEKSILMVTLSTDRGFCGSLNSNLFKLTSNFTRKKLKEGTSVSLVPWGKRARLFGQKQKLTLINIREGVLDKPSYQKAKDLAEELVGIFLRGDYDRIYISFVEFKSALTHQPKILQVLPYTMGESPQEESLLGKNLIIEPKINEILEGLLKRSIITMIYRVLLEGSASEHGARMTAMDSATNNASEVLRKMNVQYARARQAAITKELIEITSGAEAL